jgi:hypothetical protein
MHETFTALGRHRRKTNSRNAQTFGKPARINLNTAIDGNIHHIHGEDHGNIHFHELCRQKKITFQIGCIQNVHHQIASRESKYLRHVIFAIREKNKHLDIYNPNALITPQKVTEFFSTDTGQLLPSDEPRQRVKLQPIFRIRFRHRNRKILTSQTLKPRRCKVIAQMRNESRRKHTPSMDLRERTCNT